MNQEKYFVMDIETIPDERSNEYSILFPKSKKRPGLHAFRSKIVALCVLCDGDVHSIVANERPVQERTVLEWLSGFVDFRKDYNIVGYNIKNFDIPFIRVRSARHGIQCNLPGRNSYRIIDIYDLMGGKWQTDVSSGTLSELAWYLYGSKKESGDGDQVAAWAEVGEWDKIRAHCEEDVRLCDRIYKDCRDVLFEQRAR